MGLVRNGSAHFINIIALSLYWLGTLSLYWLGIVYVLVLSSMMMGMGTASMMSPHSNCVLHGVFSVCKVHSTKIKAESSPH